MGAPGAVVDAASSGDGCCMQPGIRPPRLPQQSPSDAKRCYPQCEHPPPDPCECPPPDECDSGGEEPCPPAGGPSERTRSIPQIGHLPGSGWLTLGCIGQVHRLAAGGVSTAVLCWVTSYVVLDAMFGAHSVSGVRGRALRHPPAKVTTTTPKNSISLVIAHMAHLLVKRVTIP